MDIAGAFENAWWPKIITQLKEFGICGKEIEDIKDYFRNRYALPKFSGAEKENQLAMECPQRSGLVAILWIIFFDSLLRLHTLEGCQIFAYADDVMILVKENSRSEIESKAAVACNMVHYWCSKNKLDLSIEKT